MATVPPAPAVAHLEVVACAIFRRLAAGDGRRHLIAAATAAALCTAMEVTGEQRGGLLPAQIPGEVSHEIEPIAAALAARKLAGIIAGKPLHNGGLAYTSSSG